MELHAVTIYQNSATGIQSDGGGVYIENGNFEIWSWAYTNTANPNEITRILTSASLVSDRTFTFTNQARENTPKHAESVKVNELIP